MIANNIENSSVETVEVRSALTCESKRGICAKCYGRNLATGKDVQMGEAVGVVAAQSIGEPGTQLTMRTFHVGGIAGNISEENSVISKFDGNIEIEDLKTVKGKNNDGEDVEIVISRTSEIKISDPNTGLTLSNNNIPYGSFIYVKNKKKIKKGTLICEWDPYNGVIISDYAGKISYENIEPGITYEVEIDEQTGFQEKVIIESRNKKLIPTLLVKNSKGEIFVPAAEFDPKDSEHLNEFIEVKDEGVIRSYTWIEAPRTHHLLQEPFAFALICIDGANSAMLHMIANCKESELEIGTRVKVVWNEEKSQTIRDIKYFEIIDD